jgi:hypothetical protein
MRLYIQIGRIYFFLSEKRPNNPTVIHLPTGIAVFQKLTDRKIRWRQLFYPTANGAYPTGCGNLGGGVGGWRWAMIFYPTGFFAF